MILFDAPTAADVLAGMAMLEGRLRGTGKALSTGALELRAIAERSLRSSTVQPLVPGSSSDDGDPVLTLFTYEDVADRLQVSRSTVKRLVASGVLPVVRVGSTPRIRPADLESYIASLSTQEVA